jgi:hypothetical protein
MLKEAVITDERQGERVHAERGRSVAGTARQAGVIADWAGSGEHHKGQILFGLQERGIVGGEVFGDTRQFFIRHWLRDTRKKAALPKAREMIGQAEETMVKRSAEIGRGGAEDEAGVVAWEREFRLRENPTVEVRERLSHAGSVEPRLYGDNAT